MNFPIFDPKKLGRRAAMVWILKVIFFNFMRDVFQIRCWNPVKVHIFIKPWYSVFKLIKFYYTPYYFLDSLFLVTCDVDRESLVIESTCKGMSGGKSKFFWNKIVDFNTCRQIKFETVIILLYS